MQAGMAVNRCRIVVLISGAGSNLQALIDASPRGHFTIKAAISNNPAAAGLQRAAQAGIATAVVNHRHFRQRAAFERALQQCIDTHQPELLVLAGFMRILGRDFVDHYRGRLLNIHPSLLPKYRGINTHQRVLDAGEREHGVSVHFVTEELDGGPIIAQQRVPVLPADTADSLATRVLAQEHLLYPEVVSWYAAGRLRLEADGVWLDDRRLSPGGRQMPPEQGTDEGTVTDPAMPRPDGVRQTAS